MVEIAHIRLILLDRSLQIPHPPLATAPYHGLSNRSVVPPPNPPPPLLLPGVVATGLAWLHPPKSSSCCTLNPELVFAAGLLDDEGEVISPHPLSKALVCIGAGCGGDFIGWLEVCIGGWGGAGAGSGVAHASLLPHASILFSAPKADADVEDCTGCAGLAGCGAGCDKLNAE